MTRLTKQRKQNLINYLANENNIKIKGYVARKIKDVENDLGRFIEYDLGNGYGIATSLYKGSKMAFDFRALTPAFVNDNDCNKFFELVRNFYESIEL